MHVVNLMDRCSSLIFSCGILFVIKSISSPRKVVLAALVCVVVVAVGAVVTVCIIGGGLVGSSGV